MGPRHDCRDKHETSGPKDDPTAARGFGCRVGRLKLATVRRNATEVLQVAKRRRGQRTSTRWQGC